ncbi:MAG: carboxylating nicotinate-nucleotide diphosphorylase [Candidatus Binatia bacterium]
MSDPFRHPAVARLVRLAVEEDVGRGDLTTAVTVDAGARVDARVVARQQLIVAGLPIAPLVFETLGAQVSLEFPAREGGPGATGQILVRIRGEAAAILAAERVLLNFLQRLCGVATFTRTFVNAARGTGARIVDTRKTIPGWRLLDKYAVRLGGGQNHRFGLDDGILIKDNHIAACGGIPAAVSRARKLAPHLARIEVECETLHQLDEALAAGADAILLDNMTTAELGDAVRRVAGRVIVEASGGMTLERIPEVAAAGVDLISVGALTHSAPAADLALEIAP